MPVAQNTLKAQRQSPGQMLVVNKHGPVRSGRSSHRYFFNMFFYILTYCFFQCVCYVFVPVLVIHVGT